MARKAREKYRNCIYHITARGNNKQNIFLDDEDREEFLLRLRRYEERYQMHTYAYCLMSNHVHLLIYDNNQDISRFMQGLNLSYAIYFNRKYQRSGHLFQERYYSVIVKNDAQLMYASKYIHLNPVRAQIVSKASEYKWSSFSVYITGEDEKNIIHTNFLLGLFSRNIRKARKQYDEYINSEMEETAEGEVATAAEEGEILCEIMVGLPVVSVVDIKNKLEQIWDKAIDEIVTDTDYLIFEKRLILSYLIALLGRKTYKEVSQILNLPVNEIYKMMRLLVEKMIYNQRFKGEIRKLINLNWEKFNDSE